MMSADVVIEVIYLIYLTTLPEVSDWLLITNSLKVRWRRKSSLLIVAFLLNSISFWKTRCLHCWLDSTSWPGRLMWDFPPLHIFLSRSQFPFFFKVHCLACIMSQYNKFKSADSGIFESVRRNLAYKMSTTSDNIELDSFWTFFFLRWRDGSAKTKQKKTYFPLHVLSWGKQMTECAINISERILKRFTLFRSFIIHPQFQLGFKRKSRFEIFIVMGFSSIFSAAFPAVASAGEQRKLLFACFSFQVNSLEWSRSLHLLFLQLHRVSSQSFSIETCQLVWKHVLKSVSDKLEMKTWRFPSENPHAKYFTKFQRNFAIVKVCLVLVHVDRANCVFVVLTNQ